VKITSLILVILIGANVWAQTKTDNPTPIGKKLKGK
jgi:hypothetical protein